MHRRNIWISGLPLISLLLCHGMAFAQATGSITGIVTDDKGKPLSFTNVVILGSTAGAMSDQNGRFTIRNVAAGSYNLRASQMGYTSQERAVTVGPGQTVSTSFSLKASK